MNELLLPPSPRWYRPCAVACAPDNTLVYVHKKGIVILKPSESKDEVAKIEVIDSALNNIALSVGLNKKWNDPDQLCVSCFEDNSVKVYDVKTLQEMFVNTQHQSHKGHLLGAVFANDNRVISVSTNGIIVIWNINTNETTTIAKLFNHRDTVTCFAECPFETWRVAFGLQNGIVMITDLRREGRVLYKLRGHNKSVVTLSWCPTPINVFPQSPKNKLKTKKMVETQDTDKNLGDKMKVWSNLSHVDDAELEGDPKNGDVAESAPLSDFLKECLNLKARILGENEGSGDGSPTRTSSSDNNEGKPENEVETNPNEILNAQSEEIHNSEPSNDDLPKESTNEKDDTPEKVQNPSNGNGSPPIPSSGDNKENQKSENEVNTNPDEILNDQSEEIDHSEPSNDDAPKESTNEKKKVQNPSNVRPIPTHFDPSCDIFDDLISETKEKNEDEVLEKNLVKNEDKPSEDSPENVKAPSTVVKEEEARHEYLLATSGIDKSVCIWRGGTDGTLQTMFRILSKQKSSAAKHTWITTCWISHNTLLTSSDQSELLAWTVPKPPMDLNKKDVKSSRPAKVVHNFNSGCLFNITAPINYATKDNWSEFDYDMRVWTNDMDGNLLNYDMKTHTVLYSISTTLAHVTFLENSPIDPNRVAIGYNVGCIHLWDLSKPHTNIIALKTVKKLNGKISGLVWHPTNENILAYATEEGQVGFVDVVNQKGETFHTAFKSTVYKIEWGPVVNKDDLCLYAVGDGKVVIFDMKKPKQVSMELELPEKTYICRFSWKPDRKLLMLSIKDGSLMALSSHLEIMDTLYLNERCPIHVAWHPETDSPRSGWFAASTVDGFAIYDSASIGNLEKGVTFRETRLCNFTGHSRYLTDLCWSPFDGNLIVSVGGDGLAHVWDVKEGVALATISTTDVKVPFLMVLWSPLDPDLLLVGMITGLMIRNYKKYPSNVTEEYLSARKELLKLTQKEEVKASKGGERDPRKFKIEVKGQKSGKKESKNCIIPSLYVSNDENLASQVSQMKSLLGESSSTNGNKSDVLQLFGRRDDVLMLLDSNCNQLKKEAKHSFCDLISLWKGDVASCVKEAIFHNRVTPTIIHLAPMVSPTLHQEACFIYAKKLFEEPNCNHMEATTYFLACHKIEEAIECLCAGNLFREALALAKCRLPQDCEIIVQVTNRWAQNCIENGNYETATYCYISLKEYEKAAKILSRRNNVEFLTLAAELAGKAGNENLQSSLVVKCAELQVKPLPTRAEALLGEKEIPECSSEAKDVLSEEE